MNRKIITCALVLLLGLLALSLFKVYPEVKKITGETENLEAAISQTNLENQKTDQTADYYRSDAYLEYQAKLKLNYKKPDEKVVFVYESPYNQNPIESNTAKKTDSAGLGGLLNWFKNFFNK